LRPGGEDEPCVCLDAANGIRLKPFAAASRHEPNETTYRCDHAFGADASQDQVFNQAIAPICDTVLRGYNGAVIAYGQTGSGKTYTMLGNPRNKGVVPRTIQNLFGALPRRLDWSVEVSVIEIYNEKVRDLLAPGPGVTHVEVHETRAEGGCVSFRCIEATRRPASCPEDALGALAEGMKRRETARTDMNHTSSRSHLIFSLFTSQTDRELGAKLHGLLHLVDMAGSERLKRSMSADCTKQRSQGLLSAASTQTLPRAESRDRKREAGEINKSISQLSLVIHRLTGPTSGMMQCVPYRDSMLTRILAECFGGNSKTCIIVTCSAAWADRDETRCSLEFGKRVKHVKNKAEINLEIIHEPSPVMRALVDKEVEHLNREREEMRREREVWICDRARIRERLSETQLLLQQAAEDAIRGQEARAADVRRSEEDALALQERWLAAEAKAADIQSASAAHASTLNDSVGALHAALKEAGVELVRAREEKDAVACQLEEQRLQLRSQAAEWQKALREKDGVISTLRARLLEDIAALEQEKASMAARFDAERAALQFQAQELRASAAVSGEVKASAAASGEAVEDVAAAARICEENGASLAAQVAERGAALRRGLEAARAQAAELQHRRRTRLECLEEDAAGVAGRWRQFAKV